MPWVTAFGGKVLMGVSGLAIQVRVDVSTLNDDFGVQEGDALFGPLRCKFDGWVEVVDFL